MMPPFLPRKRLRSPSPPASSRRKRIEASRKTNTDVFTALDSNFGNKTSATENRAFLEALSDEQSSLSDDSSGDEFEDVLPTSTAKHKSRGEKAASVDSDDDLEFEDVGGDGKVEAELPIPEIADNLQITVRGPGDVQPTRLTLKHGGKATITKKMREARWMTHCMHVQFLLYHNTIRNSWINNAELQLVLLNSLPEAIKGEVSRWRLAMGYEAPEKKSKGKKPKTGKEAQKSGREQTRDWGVYAEKSEDSARSDPLIRLLKYLAAYWKKRFRVTAPSLRKLGYRSLWELRQEIDSFNDGPHDPCRHGERIADLDEFKECAKKCQGSRDVGAQLFTALLRGLGIEARLVASLQPTGFGWSKVEEANPRKETPTRMTSDNRATESDVSSSRIDKGPKVQRSKASKGAKSRPIRLDADESSSSDASLTDSEDIPTPKNLSKTQISSKQFDRDLLYPTYWTEVLSPISNTYVPVSTLLNPHVVTSPDHLTNFEPRGAAAEKSKQVICYVIAFSSDGTAKDVTVRYLRKRQWPGRTKGFRISVEKLPVYNQNGKIAFYEEYDWFERVMRGYTRPVSKRTLADDIEDGTDLVPVKPDLDGKKNAAPDTLQAYKQSKEFVLERHLRREEALRPGAKPVKHFHHGKGDNAVSEPVYKRSDLVLTKTAETWHKEGRQIKVGEQPLKQVPYRAVTLQRKRELEDQARDNGEKPLQGLYAEYQTEWIVPDPIGPDGVIPKNGFGNIDVYVPSMVPKGAVHIPIRGIAKVCKKLGVEFADACTGFEFGKQRAVPVITGVVVAEGSAELVIDAWRQEEKIRVEKENKKREEIVLRIWRKFYRGLKIRERMRQEYGVTDNEDEYDDRTWSGHGHALTQREANTINDDEDVEGGGFLRNSNVLNSGQLSPNHTGGGFLVDSEAEAEPGGFEIVGDSPDVTGKRRASRLNNSEDIDRLGQVSAPMSLQAFHADTTSGVNKEKTMVDRHGPASASEEDEEWDTLATKSATKRTSKRTSSRTQKRTPVSKDSGSTSSARYPSRTDSPYF
ncbi:uncharacterized protein PV09_03093 [Verruconis gallopava]|uniref:Rad4 beta-hairpin domain-containing protein n=1 Tax=Verruconis gallopava TaxID=253628 RepID=A0A0D2B3S0_9PEZI|nr:uncharacterized protein PV09_03093 [Verruconis gallopava]KIW05899.1 hypothetical protein PV09_03093 [Verruconis gallopava]